MKVDNYMAHPLQNMTICYVQLKNEQECFIGLKTRAGSVLNDFKDIPGKACANRVHNSYGFARVGN